MPLPHSMRVKVFGPKWMKAMNSFCSAAIWLAVGTTCTALAMMTSRLSLGAMAHVCLYAIVSLGAVQAAVMQATPTAISSLCIVIRFVVVW